MPQDPEENNLGMRMKIWARPGLRIVFSFVCILLGFSLLGTYAWSIRSGFNFPLEAYWLSFVFVSIPLLCDLFFWRSSAKLRLVYLISFALIIHLQYAVIDSSPFLSSSDAIFDYKLAAQIMASNNWVPGEGVDRAVEYSFSPGSDFLYIITSMLTGFQLILVVKYLFLVKAFLVPPLIYRWYQNFFDKDVSYLGTAVLLASPGAILFPNKEVLGLIFFVLGLYAIAREARTRIVGFLAVSLLSVTVLIFTHHFTTYMLLATLASVSLLGYVTKHRSVVKPSNQFLFLCFIIFLAWIGFVALILALQDWRIVTTVLLSDITTPKLAPQQLLQATAGYERIAIWSGFVVTMLSAIMGFFIYVRNKKLRSTDFVSISVLLLSLLAVASLFRFIPSRFSLALSHRAYEFGYFSIGPLVAFFFATILVKVHNNNNLIRRSITRLILACLIILLLVSAPMANDMNPDFQTAKIAKAVTPSALSVNTWMNEFGGKANIVGDFEVDYLVFVGYGDYLVHQYYDEREIAVYPEMFSEPAVNFTHLAYRGLTGPIFVVTYDHMAEIHPSWNQTSMAKFDTSPYFQRVQSNGAFTVYLLSSNATE